MIPLCIPEAARTRAAGLCQSQSLLVVLVVVRSKRMGPTENTGAPGPSGSHTAELAGGICSHLAVRDSDRVIVTGYKCHMFKSCSESSRVKLS